MIPVGLYENKVSGLSKVLDNMGNTPDSLVSWLSDDQNRRGVEVAMLKSHADHSVALIESMPKFEDTTLLGLKLTEPARVSAAKEILYRDRTRCFSEINDIEQIRSMVAVQWERLKTRLWAIRAAKDIFWELARGGSAEGEQAWYVVDEIDRVILPVLTRLRDELYRAIRMCDREIRIRADAVDAIDRKQLSVPKYNRRARRRRLARHAAKMAAEAAAAGGGAAAKDDAKSSGGKGGKK
jgi:hypothetical protein